uniref:Ig-like domain-containing protein n=1 Tax=Oreochromis aureus TaxID=47969 RepID=A0A668UGU3_OREAU
MVRPSVSLLQPSSEKLSGGPVTLACLLTGYSPQGAEVRWEVDGTEVTEGVLNSLEEEKSSRYSNGRYSWSSTLSLSADQWRKAGSVSCEASLSGQSPVTQTLDPDQCSE